MSEVQPSNRHWQVVDPDAMSRVGVALASRLRRGDLVLLTGDLGAGKTTLAVGIGRGLNVRGVVTSPTFVIAREHPSLGDGPSLVHVDAYRLGGLDELEDLDLSASLEDSVTLVEWGHGLAEGLTTQRLEILLDRSSADDVRLLRCEFTGDRWDESEQAALAAVLNKALQQEGD